MEGLRDLRAVVVEDWLDRDPESEAKLLEPLRAVKGTEVFEVDVSWPANEGERPRNVPFRIKSERKELERERKGSRGCSSPSAVRKTDLEVQKGKNIAVAAAGVDTLERLVFSLLSNARKWSKGKYTWVYHFDSKARVAEYIAEALPELNKKMSILQVGLFATNWKISLFTPQEVSKIGPAFDTSTLVDTPPSIEVPDRSRPSRQDEADCIVAIGRVVCAESPGRWSQAYAYGSHSQRHWVFCEGTG